MKKTQTKPIYTKTRVDYDNIKVGDHICRIGYYKVKAKDEAAGTFTVEDDYGFEIKMSKNICKQEMYSASHYNSTFKISREEICEKLAHAKDIIVSICFTKKADPKSIAQKIQQDLITDKKKITAVYCKNLFNIGDERTLVCKVQGTNNKMGKTFVIDLDMDPIKSRIKQIDNRLIQWIIMKNVKYTT